MISVITRALLIGISLALANCGDPASQSEQTETPAVEDPAETVATTETVTADDSTCDNFAETRIPLFGDLHVHTSFSFDAAAMYTRATPDDAHRYAKGEPIPYWPLDENGQPTGTAQIDRPLDFLAVTDHGEFLGERAMCITEGSASYNTPFCQQYRAEPSSGAGVLAGVIFSEAPKRMESICGEDGSLCREFARTPWQRIQESANAANEPCTFTAFIGYEYTGTPGGSNYHRNVIFKGDVVPDLPVSYIDAPIDSKLWAQLDASCREEDGCTYLTIPHNSNLANGRMAPYRLLEATLENKRNYANTRLLREPIIEIFQHKGGSECVNGLSSVLGAPDELCNVESVRRLGKEQDFALLVQNDEGEVVVERHSELITECEPGKEGENGMLGAGCVDPTDFHRSALLVGLKEEQETGLNPIKLGVIASTDAHTATPGGVSEESWGGAVVGETSPAERLQKGVLTSGIDGNPGGLAGVWARENTRDEVFAAMQRREVFGTSGPRIMPRLFAGWDFPADSCDRNDRDALGYDNGVPMGGDLAPSTAEGKPQLLVYATKDPNSLDLQSLQVIKGWIEADGTMKTEVIPVGGSAEGASSLCALYTDEAFDPAQSTYYYARVVEQKRARWHTYDCAKLAEADRPAVCSDGSYPETVNEMAWTSPIWYRQP